MPVKPKFIGISWVLFNIISMYQGLGVQVVALVPALGPVPPPIIVVTPDARLSGHWVGEI